MELRDIEIFLTLAEELHFGRTAQRLHLSQARVSQSVKSQERRIGARLVDRSNPRNVQLTLLGRQLLAELLPAYRDLVKAIDHARLTARGISGLLRVGMIGFNAYDYQPFWDAFQARHPQWELQVRNISFNDPFGLLRRGDADIVIAWLPIEDPDLTVGPVIATEPMAAMMSDRHELMRRQGRVAGDLRRPRDVRACHAAARALGGRLHPLPHPYRPTHRTCREGRDLGGAPDHHRHE